MFTLDTPCLNHVKHAIIPTIHRILTTSSLCLTAAVCVGCTSTPGVKHSGNMANEWQNYYPDDSAIVQACVSKMEPTDSADLEEGRSLYIYFVADDKIAYIEESWSTSQVAVCIRYLFDESGNFVAASCRTSILSALSDEWSHNQKLLVPGQRLNVDRCGINEAIDKRANRIMKLCVTDLEHQSKKIRK